ncbi:MAG: addiction module protein [Cytophagales bacterium]|nr:addiction module protein [Cytophagales bacterium]
MPEWHKKILDERLSDYQKNPSDVLRWEDVKNIFRIR